MFSRRGLDERDDDEAACWFDQFSVSAGTGGFERVVGGDDVPAQQKTAAELIRLLMSSIFFLRRSSLSTRCVCMY